MAPEHRSSRRGSRLESEGPPHRPWRGRAPRINRQPFDGADRVRRGPVEPGRAALWGGTALTRACSRSSLGRSCGRVVGRCASACTSTRWLCWRWLRLWIGFDGRGIEGNAGIVDVPWQRAFGAGAHLRLDLAGIPGMRHAACGRRRGAGSVHGLGTSASTSSIKRVISSQRSTRDNRGDSDLYLSFCDLAADCARTLTACRYPRAGPVYHSASMKNAGSERLGAGRR